ncbi:MAG: hypothetical protein R3F61_09075 [Myxococcota bacterium]
MQRTRRSSVSQASETRSASLEAPTNNEKASDWGNGLTAQSVHGPTGSGSGIGNSFLGIGQDLASAPSFTGPGQRTWSDWLGGGFGAAYGGELGAGGFSQKGGIGFGAGGGGGTWNETNGSITSSGFGGGAAIAGRVDANTSYGGQSYGFGGDVYRGVGGSGYEFSDSKTGRSGYGLSGGYTPIGVNDGYSRLDTSLGSQETRVGQFEYGRVGGNLEGYTTEGGGFGVQGGWSQGRTTARDISSTTTTGLGTTEAHVGQVAQGRYYTGSAGRDDDGRYHAGLKRGGSLTVNDASVNHTWANGMTTEASLGRFGGNKTEGEIGFNPNTGAVDFNGTYSTGKSVKDANFRTDLPGGGSAAAHLGEWSNGSQYRIDPGSHIGPDGVHVSGGGHLGHGFAVSDVGVEGGWDGVYSGKAGLESFSNREELEGAHLDIDGNGVNAGFERMRTGGFIAEGITAEQDVLGVKSNISVGEVSNDTLINGGRLGIDGSGVHAGFEELDFGGVRVKDVNYNADILGAASVNASMGSYTDGNSIKGANVDITRDGLNASVEEFGVAGRDLNDVHIGVEGPGGTHANADLGAYHTGITGKNAYAEINGNGVQVGAEHLAYDQHSLDNVNLSAGMDGVYETHASLGHGHMNHASADNVNVGLDRNGLSASADNVNYSYLGVEDFKAGQSFGDGAVETELALGRGDYLGGSADHIEFQSNLLNTSASVDGLNAHGLQLEDLNAHVGVGDAGLDVGADELDVLDLNVGHADFHRENFGLSGGGNIQDAQLDVLDAKGLGGGVTWGDQTVAEARTDLNLSAGVDRASGEWDVLNGTASGQFENANVSLMSDNTHLSLLGNDLDIGRTGANINASGSGAVDVSKGQASGDINFAGSELALFGNSVTVGDWAQASGSVDVLNGQGNFNVGGENGVGADVDIGAGNLDLHAFGHTIDVDEGVRDGVEAVKDGAAWVGDRVGDGIDAVGRGASYVGDKASQAAGWAGDRLSDAGSAISSGASKAWDVVTSW